LATRTDEFFEARVAGSNRRKLDDARGLHTNGSRGRFSAGDQGNRDAFARNRLREPESALHVPDAEQVLYVKQDRAAHKISRIELRWSAGVRTPATG
jgi:hypothetical protein